MATEGEPKVVMSGIIHKKKPGGFIKRGWQARYFTLSTETLIYRKKEGELETKGEIPLFMVTGVTVPNGKKAGRFDVNVGEGGAERVFSLMANTVEEADDWVSKIRGCVRAAKTENKGVKIQDKGGDAKKFWKDPKELGRIRQAKLKSMFATTSFLHEANAKKTETTENPFMISLTKVLKDTPLGELYLSHNRAVANSRYTMHSVRKNLPRVQEAKLLFHEMRELDHPYLLRQAHHGESADTIWSMYEPAYGPSRTLLHALGTHKRLPVDVCKYFATQLVLVLSYLHLEMGYTLRNLCPESICVQNDATILINDLFLAVPAAEMPESLLVNEYNSPEHYTGEEDRVADWWRLGVLLYEMSVGIPPIRAKKGGDWKAAITSFDSSKLAFPPWVPADLKDLIQKLLVVDITKRLGAGDNDAEDIQEHPWWGLSAQAWDGFAENPIPNKWVVDKILSNFNISNTFVHADSTPKANALACKVLSARDYTIFSEDERGTSRQDQAKAKNEKLYCKVMCCQKTEKTQECDTHEKMPFPKWDDTFKWVFTGQPANEVVHVKLIDCHRGFDSVVGDLEINVREIARHPNQQMTGWYSIIDPAKGITNGEMQMDLRWMEDVGDADSARPQILPNRMSAYFGLAISTPKEATFRPAPKESDVPPPPGGEEEEEESDDDDDIPEEAEEGDKGKRGVMSKIRGAVSKKKVRFQKDGFDLDLTYITPHIIAMGLPSQGTQSAYRNPMPEVIRFFDKYHQTNYKIYNLCSESQYLKTSFPGNGGVAEFPFDDHNAPPFKLLLDICEDIQTYLRDNANAVVSIHCKAGKGRTGTVIACYLMYSMVCDTADEALMFFAKKRTQNTKGVTIPSQRRYVQYFERFLRNYSAMGRPFPLDGKSLTLRRVRFTTIPQCDMPFGCDPYFRVKGPYPRNEVFYDHLKVCKGKVKGFHERDMLYADIILGSAGTEPPLLFGDLNFTFYDHDKVSTDVKIASFWIHTSFIEHDYVALPKMQVDKACKDKEGHIFKPGFKIELFFDS